jgi:YHS domain-containing protein
MKSLQRFFRYIFWTIFTAAIAWVIRKSLQRAAQAPMAGRHASANVGMQKREALVRDPVCGTYVAEDIAFSLVQGGQSLHFCSRDCMQHYQAANRLAAGA